MLQSSLYRHRTRVERTVPRLYHSSPLRNKNNGNDTNEEGFLVKAKNALQQLSPTNWFLSDEERRAKAERKRVKAAVKSELQQVLKDAPLPLRMLGGIVGNVLSNLVSNVAQVASSQQDMVDTVYQRAVANIQRDPAVADALGVSGGSNAAGAVVVVGPPYAQSSSSSSINGATTMRIEMSFPVGVGGGGRQGVGRLVASRQGSSNNDENNISFQVLEVQVNGRTIPVSTTLRGNVQSKKFYGPSSNDSDIIEAEIIEKETKTK